MIPYSVKAILTPRHILHPTAEAMAVAACMVAEEVCLVGACTEAKEASAVECMEEACMA